MNNGKQLRADDSDESNDESNESNDEGSDEEMPSSSDDDSDVDFVKLQNNRKPTLYKQQGQEKG